MKLKLFYLIIVLAFIGTLVCTSAHAVCIGSPVQCNAYAQQQYGVTYQQYEQSQQQSLWNQPTYQTYEQPQVNQNGFDRYGHYHAPGY